LQERVVDPREALRQAFLVTQAAGEAKGLRMALEGLDTLPAAILVDGARLKQAIINLLGNAVKFTEAGEVVLSARIVAPAGAGGPVLRIVVRDTGVGLAADALARVFEPFEQGGEAQARFGGGGRGLSIVRAIVRSMGGRVEAQSEPGVGSSFGFEIPLRLAQAAPAPRPAPIGATPERGPSRRILVAEDVGTNQMVIEALLASLGHRATIVGDGAQALARAAEEPFDLIMLDMRMPHLDGLETARRLRAMDGPAARLPIVALTANAFPQDREACRLAGMDDFLSKPFDRAQIEAVIQRLCAEPQGAPMTNATTDDAQPAPENPAAVCEAPRCAVPAFAVEGATLHLCARHAQAVPEPLRARLQAYWDDEAAYAALVASGRYLKLAHASCCAEEHEEAARQSALLAILLAEGTQTDAAPDAPRRIA